MARKFKLKNMASKFEKNGGKFKQEKMAQSLKSCKNETGAKIQTVKNKINSAKFKNNK